MLCFGFLLKAAAQTPVISSPPQSVTVNTASDAQFYVTATNAAAYQWLFNSAPLAGQTNASLDLEDVSSNEAGSYSVVVTSSGNASVTSAPPAVLTIVPGTIIQWTITNYPGGGSSNFLVQLFDHDKPATVENFIHYVTSGAYSNMFFDRDVTNFVLQGGDYVATNRSATNVGVEGMTAPTNFPSHIDSECGLGPLIHNRFGTIAMAMVSTNTNSASAAFYFNTHDNATYLDGLSFTVFGRVLDGTNSGSSVLQYFNTLSAPSNGIYSGFYNVPTIPVNYNGTNEPANDNFFYSSFAFVSPSTNPPADTTPPAVSIASPTAGELVDTTGSWIVTGTASDNVGIAEVYFVLTALTGGSAGITTTNYAIGTANWSLPLASAQPGDYQLTAYAVDGAGNASAPYTIDFTSANSLPAGILTEPQDVTARVGDTATFSVTATNAVSYQWILAGSGPISGATNSTLVFTNASTSQSGSQYEVVVTAPDGSTVTSSTATLTVVTGAGTLVRITFSGFAGGGSSNVIVQLYDQEKPATVANFLRYLSPANFFGIEYQNPLTNMFWDKVMPGYILQGGAYDARDQTNSVPPANFASTVTSVYSSFTTQPFFRPRFAAQVDNEYNVGPIIPNTFGTLAAAKTPGYPDSAANAFFFNLADNSSTLDTTDGGYTVFGRVISGTNVLNYFNTLSKPIHGIYDSTMASSSAALPDLPVNYIGYGSPADTNLFFGAFKVLSAYTADTNPPSVSVTYPTDGASVTNADVTVLGTASDDIAVANVSCTVTGSNYNGFYYAQGTTNWSAAFPKLVPGVYTNLVTAQDGTGNTSSAVTNTFIVPRLPFVSKINGNGTSTADAFTGTNAALGSNYSVTAKPARGSMFLFWSYGTNAYRNPTLAFDMTNGFDLTANFITNTVPGGLEITSPSADAGLDAGTVRIQGTLAAKLVPGQVTVQVFSGTMSNAVTAPIIIDVTKRTWSAPILTLPPGGYHVEAWITSSQGSTAANSAFGLRAPLSVTIYGRGAASCPNNLYLSPGFIYQEFASPAPGWAFYSWKDGYVTILANSFPFAMSVGLSFTATFIPLDAPGKISFARPAASSVNASPNVTFSGRVSVPNVAQVVCQLFNGTLAVTGFTPATVSGDTWELTVTNLAPGQYTARVIAIDTKGRTALAGVTFAENYYPLLAGAYRGLFFSTNALTVSNAGSVALNVSGSGAVSGALATPARNYPVAFNMGFNTALNGKFYSTGRTPISLDVSFDTTNFSGLLRGTIALNNQTVPLVAYRIAKKLSADSVLAPGRYALALQPAVVADSPASDSFAAMNAGANGSIAVAGALADNSPFSLSTGVFTNGVWPLYSSVHGGHEFLIGWETNTSGGGSSGTLYWLKNPGKTAYYPGGVSEMLSSTGTNYSKPSVGIPYQIVFSGGTLTTPVTNDFTFSSSGAFVPGTTVNKLHGSLVASTGAIKGSIAHPDTNATLDFEGIFLDPPTGGAGFTLDANGQTGSFVIAPVPH